MDTNYSSVSVYELITKLCERTFVSCPRSISSKTTKRLRAKAYEVLLSKRVPEKADAAGLENTKDPYCHLLAWQFVLIHSYGLSEHANKLQECVDALQKCDALPDNVLNSVLYLLLQFREIPEPENNNIYTPRSGLVNPCQSSKSFFRQFDNSEFKLQLPIICAGSRFSDESFHLKIKRNIKKTASYRLSHLSNITQEKCKSCTMCPNQISCKSSSVVKKDEILMDDTEDVDIWDIVSQTKFTDHRTWETLGDPCPEHELPFVTEASPEVTSWIYKSQTLQLSLMNDDFNVPIKVIARTDLIRHIKFLLVGIPSDSFKYDVNGRLVLTFGTCIEGVTCSALETYCKNLIFCGNCYKALNEMCVPRQSNNQGFIFKELCESIKRYLSCYRIAISTISESGKLLTIHEHIRQLHAHLDVLASVCKVGPFTESEQLPNGIALLNYLYEKIISLCDRNVIMVLYSVLYPCIQVYFNSFLQQWIFEGCVNDPYNEFFVSPTQKYLNSRGRTYWTRSYNILQDVVPDFLSDLSNEILICGKSINLLKLCMPNSPLCIYLMGKKPALLSCCLTFEKLKILEQNTSCYCLEVLEECGPPFSFEEILRCSYEQEITFMNLVTKKRAATLKRLELEKLKKAQDDSERKRLAVEALRRQYDEALRAKRAREMEEIEREIKMNEIDLKMQNLREKLIEKEANELISYYNNLNEKLEQKRLTIEKRIKRFKNQSDVFIEAADSNEPNKSCDSEDSNRVDDPNSTSESYQSVSSTTPKNYDNLATDAVVAIHSSESLDLINANADVFDDNTETPASHLASTAAENFEIARRNREKVMSVEMGVNAPRKTVAAKEMSALQKNRLKMMHSDFSVEVKDDGDVYAKKTLSIMETNRRRNMGHTKFTTDNFAFVEAASETRCDNENFLNKNLVDENKRNEINGNVETVQTNEKSKASDLKLDFSKIGTPSIFSKFLKSPNFELNRPTPMSIDSTPCTDVSSTSSRTLEQFESLTTAATLSTDDGRISVDVDLKKPIFSFPKMQDKNVLITDRSQISKRVSVEDAAAVSTSCLKLCIQESVAIPLKAQKDLVNSELLKYFIHDLQYLTHLKSLRNYFFLLDGEFGRNITEGLFEKLYDANFPVDLINIRTLQHLVYNAMDSSIKLQENLNCLSFKINNLPETFDLRSPDVLDCLSLTYKVTWPLNIILPSDTIGKYDEVFKFLLKLHRVSWVLKKIFQELKALTKETGKRSAFLQLSPQFLKLHQCRHIMVHFMQTLQNYVVGEVLQTSWNVFEKKLASVTNLDELYSLHTTYIKDVLFMCLLNQRSAPIRILVHNVFVVILKFYDHLRLKQWEFDEDVGVYVHPNFRKLEDIFGNFEEIVTYLYKTGCKVANVGYQPHLIQLLDMLHVNDYYTRKMSPSK